MDAEPGGGMYGCGGKCGGIGYIGAVLETEERGGDILRAFSIASAVKPVIGETTNKYSNI